MSLDGNREYVVRVTALHYELACRDVCQCVHIRSPFREVAGCSPQSMRRVSYGNLGIHFSTAFETSRNPPTCFLALPLFRTLRVVKLSRGSTQGRRTQWNWRYFSLPNFPLLVNFVLMPTSETTIVMDLAIRASDLDVGEDDLLKALYRAKLLQAAWLLDLLLTGSHLTSEDRAR